jgi:hypothetical protein
MSKLTRASLILVVSLLAFHEGRAELTRDSKIYIRPFNQFETYLAAAFSKKHIPLVIVQTPEQAELTLTILNSGQRVTGLRIENAAKEIVWTYLFPKPVDAQLKYAEKCASQLRREFPLSAEELAEREQRRQERRQPAASTSHVEVTQLYNGRFSVGPGKYLTIPFRIVDTTTVRGNFEVGGGSGNDVQVVIGPRSEVLNWLNGHGGSPTYVSEKVTSGTLDVPVSSPGDYVLVFSNLFSFVSAKTVVANIQLVSGGPE